VKTAALVLAAGQSRRMGKANKLLARIEGKALVRTAVEAAAASRADRVFAVTGHGAAKVEEALDGLEVTCIRNPDYAEGLATSLAAGIDSLAMQFDRAIILLGDMPLVTSAMIDRMIETADASPVGVIIVATNKGRRGNPALFPKAFFDELRALRGDTGARHLIAAHKDQVVEVEFGQAASADIDTPEALARAGGRVRKLFIF